MSDENSSEDSTPQAPQTPPKPTPPQNLEFKGGGDAKEKQITAEKSGTKKE